MQSAARERVLVVDDEPQVLVALEDLLSDRYVVFKTHSAEEALGVLEQEPEIAVVITDQRMPRMSGDELLARLGVSSDAQRILLTGFADLSAVIRAVNDGRISAYVTKPWSPQDLMLKVQTAADHFRLTKDLALERQLLHDLMDNIPDGIHFKGPDLRFRRANRSFAAMMEVDDPERIVGKRFDEISPDPSSVSATELEERRVLASGKPALDVVREYRWNGTRHWLSETRAPIRDPQGGVVGLVGISRDVTERVRTQEALRESKEQLHEQSRILNSILDSMGEGVIAVGKDRQILLFNKRAREILGTPSSSVLPANWTDFHGAYQADGTTRIPEGQDPLLRAIKGENVPETEVFVRQDEENGVMVAVSATALLDHDGNLVGGIALLRDVTQQRNLERQFAQSQKMDAIGRLAGGVAHDFNNLLAVILSYAELAMKPEGVAESTREDLREITAAAERASGLTRQLLAFSRRQVVQRRTLQLNDLVTDVEKMLRRVIGEDIALMTRPWPALGTVKADAGQIEQIILNLTVNARDAMPDGGKLTIETANVTLGEDYTSGHSGMTPGEFVMLAVSDTGTGMDAETKRRMCEPFFTTKGVGKGTGLGLATVYGLVEQSGGHISVYSEVNRGTSFKVYFPRVDGVAGERAPSGMATAPAGGTGTILLVEDDEAVRRVALRILRECGYTVLEARNAADARRFCAEEGSAIDLLVTDVVMPEINGPKLAEELSAICPRMRVLFMSGYPGAAVVHEGLMAAEMPYIEKPFSPVSLADKVHGVLVAER
ncbi:MAG TPA: response regulator [Polyangiaceae bacterium]